LSFFLHEPVDAFTILAIVLLSGPLGFWQERGASNAVEKLLSIVRITAAVLRDGSVKEIPVEEIVPGDKAVSQAFKNSVFLHSHLRACESGARRLQHGCGEHDEAAARER